jgi:hypothetical protein
MFNAWVSVYGLTWGSIFGLIIRKKNKVELHDLRISFMEMCYEYGLKLRFKNGN